MLNFNNSSIVHFNSCQISPSADSVKIIDITTSISKVELGDNVTIRLDLDNAPQPDGVLMIDGGQASVSSDDYIEGAPELVVEIAASSAAYDLYDKKRAYRRNGIREYLVWRVYDREFDWFVLEEGEYIKQEADNGIIQSRIFPGLWLAVDFLLAGEMQQVLAVLQQGLDSTEHQEFLTE